MKSVIIIGGGTSTEGFNWDLIKNKSTIGINYAYKLITPTILTIDNNVFYDSNMTKLEVLNCPMISHHCNRKNVINIPPSDVYYGRDSLKKGKIYTHYLTGIYSITLALALGYDTIFLLGYDMNVSKDYRVHNKNLKHPEDSIAPYRPQMSRFNVFKNEKNIYNVNPNSALKVFPKISYTMFEAVLKRIPDTDQRKERIWIKKKLKIK